MSLGRYRASVDYKNCIFLNCNFPNCIFQNSIFFQTVFFAVYLANESSKLCEFILTERGVSPPTPQLCCICAKVDCDGQCSSLLLVCLPGSRGSLGLRATKEIRDNKTLTLLLLLRCILLLLSCIFLLLLLHRISQQGLKCNSITHPPPPSKLNITVY